MPKIPFATQSYKSKSLPISAQRLLNMYAEKEPPDAKTQVAVFGCPGLAAFTSVGTGPLRNAHVMSNVLYVVSGSELWSVNSLGDALLLGGGIDGSGRVSMDDNGNQVVIVNGIEGFIYTLVGFGSAAAATIQSAGTGYVIGEMITLTGGTSTSQTVITVLSIGGGGAIATIQVSTPGQYQAEPSNPVAQGSTTGVGIGATFNVTFAGPPSGYQKITDPAFNPANTVTFFDGYFLFDWVGTAKFFYSALYDGSTYNALNYYTAEVHPNGVLGLVNQQENLLVFCESNIETWYDTGTNNDPFQRYNGATIERGCAAPLTLLKEDNSVFFLGEDRIFYRLDGIIPKRLSTHAIEQEWQTYSTVADAFAFVYTFEGHKFVTIIFPTANTTWVYDIASQLWHERESFETNGRGLGRWRGNCSVNFNNRTLIGDGIGNQLGVLSSTDYTEYGAQIIGSGTMPVIHNDRKYISHQSLEFDMDTGVGLATGQGQDPQLMLDWSDDGGKTYVPLQRWASMGQSGQTTTRVRFTRLGRSRSRVYRASISDPVRRTFIAAHADLEKCDF